MKEKWQNLGMDTAASAANFGIEQVGNAINMKRQHKYQKKINKFNQELAYDLWERTGPKGMMEQLTNAGLNPGLMYGMSGAGAGTTATGAGSGTGSQSANAQAKIGMALQLQQQKALIENTKADTALKQTDANRGKETVNLTIAQTGNVELDNKIKEIELRIAEDTEELRKETPELLNRRLNQEIEKIVEETRKTAAEGKIAQETADSVIIQTKNRTIEQGLRIALQRAGVTKMQAETTEVNAKIEKIAAEIVRMQEQTKQGETSLSQEDQKIILEKIKTEFNTGDSAETLRWINAVGGIGTNLFKKALTPKAKNKDFPAKKPDWMSQKQWEYINNND